MSENITAYTAPGATYPEYVSINERDGQVEITVRAPATADGQCGVTAAMKMTWDAFDRLIAEASVELAARGR